MITIAFLKWIFTGNKSDFIEASTHFKRGLSIILKVIWFICYLIWTFCLIKFLMFIITTSFISWGFFMYFMQGELNRPDLVEPMIVAMKWFVFYFVISVMGFSYIFIKWALKKKEVN
jgi:hypothetical protein